MNNEKLIEFKKKANKENKGKRFLAAILNAVIYSLIFLLFAFLVGAIFGSILYYVLGMSEQTALAICLGILVVMFLIFYYYFPELGKKILGLEVVDINTGEFSSNNQKMMDSAYIQLFLFSLIPIPPLGTFIIISYFVAFFLNMEFWRRSTVVLTEEQYFEFKKLQNYGY